MRPDNYKNKFHKITTFKIRVQGKKSGIKILLKLTPKYRKIIYIHNFFILYSIYFLPLGQKPHRWEM